MPKNKKNLKKTSQPKKPEQFVDVETLENQTVAQDKTIETNDNNLNSNLSQEKIKNNKYSYSQEVDLKNKHYANNNTKIFSLLFAMAGIVFTLVMLLHVVPNVILTSTDSAKAEIEKKSSEANVKARQEELKGKLAEENKTLVFNDQNVNLAIKDYGNLKISLKDKAAPQTTENFIRLVSRGYYNGIGFHRIVKQENFSVIQGGDPTGNGNGGESASGKGIPDELWEIKPEFESQDGTTRGQIKNEPKFKDDNLYRDYNRVTGEVVYAKGLILMAKTNQPDSASSQFFVTLKDTKLPAQYTVFGVVNNDNFETLDKISQNINPLSANPTQTGEVTDGKPDKLLLIEKAEIVK